LESDDDLQTPFILLVDRGGCTFVKKVRLAQRFGAAAVILADNACLCSDQECVDAYPDQNNCETTEPIMADDGSGSDISIPSMLLFKKDADAITNVLLSEEHETVVMKLSWELPQNDNVQYSLWTTPTDRVSLDFLMTFGELDTCFGESASFTPHMYIYDGVRTHCTDNGENLCYSLCTNNGRYFCTDPDDDLDRGFLRADVVEESLRRLCIWKRYSETEEGGGGRIKWWNCVRAFEENCYTPELFMQDDCVHTCYDLVDIYTDAVDSCTADSGGLEGDVPNSMFDAEVLPSLQVNYQALRGQLTSHADTNLNRFKIW
jgi:hypothetical protein